MGGTGEADRKRQFNSISSSPTSVATNAKKHPFVPSFEDKKLDTMVLKFQNQKLVQKLESQNVEYVALDNKFSQLREKQLPYNNTLAVVDKSWDESVLKYELRKDGAPHDCLEDARAAMKLALAKIQGGDDNAIMLTRNEALEADIMKLLCHRIPISVPGENLLEFIAREFTVELELNKKSGGDKYTSFAVFKNKQEADDAFKGLVGDLAKVSDGSRDIEMFSAATR